MCFANLLRMKKYIVLLAALLLVVSSAKANFYWDDNPADVYLNVFNPSYTGEFTLDGYDPATETVIDAYAMFDLWDLLGNEKLTITMYGETYFDHGSFRGVLFADDYINPDWTAWAVLDATGALKYTVTNTGNLLSEFWLTNAYLEVETEPRNVPDAGATSVFLGLGLVLVLGAKRRFSAVR
jgi:hypothetical protein